MDKQSLTYITFKNISYSLVGYVWGFVFSIVITPIIVFKLGVENYGVYLLVITVSNLTGLLDIGIGQMLVKFISQYTASGEARRLKDLMYSFNLLIFGTSLVILAVFAVVGYWAKIFFPDLALTREYYFTLFFLAGLISFFGGLNTLFATVPVALMRGDISIKIGLANLTLSNLTILLVVVLGYGLKGVFLAQLVFSVMLLLTSRHYAKKILPSAELKFAWVWEEVKCAYKFGVATYMSNVANSALTYFDRLLIPIFFGPSALSYYSLPGNIASKVSVMNNTLSGTIFPMTSGLHGLKDMEKIRHIYKRAFNLLTVVNFAMVISIILFANKMLLYWLNADFALKSTTVLIILSATYYLLSLGGTLNLFLLGLSKTNFLFKSSVLMAATNIILLFFLLPKFGIVGAAWAYLISVLPIIYMFYFMEKKILGLSGRFIDYLKLYTKLGVVFVLFAVVCKWGILPLVNSLKSVIVFGPLSTALYLFIYWVFGFFEKEDVNAIKLFILSLTKKMGHSK